jgi:hypothetical protein
MTGGKKEKLLWCTRKEGEKLREIGNPGNKKNVAERWGYHHRNEGLP